jgi:hypothetical protein
MLYRFIDDLVYLDEFVVGVAAHLGIGEGVLLKAKVT